MENADFGFMCQAISLEAARFLCQPSQAQYQAMRDDFHRLGVRRALLKLFKKFDLDANSTVSRSEFGLVLRALRPNWSPANVEIMFEAADADTDGNIDLG